MHGASLPSKGSASVMKEGHPRPERQTCSQHKAGVKLPEEWEDRHAAFQRIDRSSHLQELLPLNSSHSLASARLASG